MKTLDPTQTEVQVGDIVCTPEGNEVKVIKISGKFFFYNVPRVKQANGSTTTVQVPEWDRLDQIVKIERPE